jgi:hypothetical protein
VADTIWTIRGREFAHCNCAYGCPCQFNALPPHGNCHAVIGIEIEEGHHRDTRLDGLKFAGVLKWPRAIHEEHGEALIIIDKRANAVQREALLRIIRGQDTELGATFFQVFSSTLEKVHHPVFAKIEFDVDVEARKAVRLLRRCLSSRVRGVTNELVQLPFM